jgi:hypothetical protein
MAAIHPAVRFILSLFILVASYYFYNYANDGHQQVETCSRWQTATSPQTLKQIVDCYKRTNRTIDWNDYLMEPETALLQIIQTYNGTNSVERARIVLNSGFDPYIFRRGSTGPYHSVLDLVAGANNSGVMLNHELFWELLNHPDTTKRKHWDEGIQDAIGFTTLHHYCHGNPKWSEQQKHAKWNDCDRIIRRFTEIGADMNAITYVNAESDGETPFSLAIKSGYVPLVEQLIIGGANFYEIDCTDTKNISPEVLELIQKYKNPVEQEMTEKLDKFNANTSLSQYVTSDEALDLALKYQAPTLFKLIIANKNKQLQPNIEKQSIFWSFYAHNGVPLPVIDRVFRTRQFGLRSECRFESTKLVVESGYNVSAHLFHPEFDAFTIATVHLGFQPKAKETYQLLLSMENLNLTESSMAISLYVSPPRHGHKGIAHQWGNSYEILPKLIKLGAPFFDGIIREAIGSCYIPLIEQLLLLGANPFYREIQDKLKRVNCYSAPDLFVLEQLFHEFQIQFKEKEMHKLNSFNETNLVADWSIVYIAARENDPDLFKTIIETKKKQLQQLEEKGIHIDRNQIKWPLLRDYSYPTVLMHILLNSRNDSVAKTVECIELVMNSGFDCDLNMPIDNGGSILGMAVAESTGSDDIHWLLLNYPNISIESPNWNNTFRLYIYDIGKQSAANILKFTLKYIELGVNIDDDSIVTAVKHAGSGSPQLLHALLMAGAKVDKVLINWKDTIYMHREPEFILLSVANTGKYDINNTILIAETISNLYKRLKSKLKQKLISNNVDFYYNSWLPKHIGNESNRWDLFEMLVKSWIKMENIYLVSGEDNLDLLEELAELITNNLFEAVRHNHGSLTISMNELEYTTKVFLAKLKRTQNA